MIKVNNVHAQYSKSTDILESKMALRATTLPVLSILPLLRSTKSYFTPETSQDRFTEQNSSHGQSETDHNSLFFWQDTWSQSPSKDP